MEVAFFFRQENLKYNEIMSRPLVMCYHICVNLFFIINFIIVVKTQLVLFMKGRTS